MSRASIERKLTDLATELRALRRELQVIDEQLQHFVDVADDARLRSLISETPLAANEHREANKAVAAVRRDQEAMMKRVAKLETKQDTLLDQLSQARS
ncbi:MAG: hypothetical protein GY724_03495 [Actinomycetia bacterium]|nr:hypothetical protein [Actinomycetes bacterium]MCP5032818.1 hypothetical protein [Actinomycetes bacterium]